MLQFIGFEVDGAVPVYTDNKAAHDLCNRFTTAQNSRHVDRKMFKMRELRGAGVVEVMHIATELNPSDLFTKVLGRQVFEKHRSTVLNLSARKSGDFTTSFTSSSNGKQSKVGTNDAAPAEG